MHDLRYALRQLAKTPGFTAIALLTLALGIGVNTTMFSALNAVLFHVPMYPEPDRLIRVYRTSATLQTAPHSPANFLDLQAQNRSFAQLAVFAGADYSLAEPGQTAERIRGLDVSGDFFAAFGVAPALGRYIGREDDQPGNNRVIVLSDTLWRRRFNADPAIVGQPIRLGGEAVTVIGVMPPGFDDPFLWGQAAAWRPLAFTLETRQNRGGNYLNMLGRLRPGVTEVQALVEFQTLGANLGAAHPAQNARTGYTLMPLVRSTQNNTGRVLSWFTMGLAGCVLLIACANLANLLFARNALRARDHAIRTALGASRLHLIRLALTESLMLALGGGALGLLVATWGNELLSAQLIIGGQPVPLAIEWPVVGFTLAATALSGIGFGLLPALLASRVDVNEALKQGARGGTSGAQHRLRHALIVTEVALALVLLSGAGFFLRGLDRFLARDYGWRTENLLTAQLTLPAAKYPNSPAIVGFYERLQARLAVLPGVERVGLSRTLPFADFGFGQRFVVEGRPPPTPGTEVQRDLNGVSPEYFETVGLALVAGRNFTAADREGPIRTVISESMARQVWPGEDPIGKRIRHPSDTEWQEVIGVVCNVTFAANLDRATSVYQAYRLLAREPFSNFSISLRTTVPPATLMEAVRRAVAEIDPELPLGELRAADQVIENRLANTAFVGRLLTGFASLGLLLAAVGLYGVISGFVTQRTREIGLRMALGAQVRDVLQLVLGQGLRLTLVGVALGLGGAFGVARLLVLMMPAFPAAETATAAGIAGALLVVALLACWLPARRAARVEPMIALRAE